MLPLVLAALLLHDAALGQLPPPSAPRPPRAATTPRPSAGANLPAAPSAPGVLRGDWPAVRSGKVVTLDDTVSVDDALEQIADAADWNVVLNTGRTGNVQLVLKLRATPVEDALEATLAGTGLAATRRGQTVIVAPSGAKPERPVLSGFEHPTGKTFSGDFQDAEVGEALRRITDAAGLSLMLPPGLHGTVTAHFRASPVEDALRAVLSQSGLTAERQGTLVTVTRGGRGAISAHGPGFSVDVDVDALREQADDAGPRAGGTPPGHRGLARNQSGDRVVHGDVVVEPGDTARDVVAIRGSVTLRPGAEARDVVAILGTVKLEPGAQVREATAIAGNVEVGPGAAVRRDATAVGGSVRVDPSGEVGREQTSVDLPGIAGFGSAAATGLLFGRPANPLLAVGQALARFVVYFALGLLLLALSPRRLEGVAASLAASPGKNVLAGLLGTVAMPLLTVLLIVTIIGIPLVAVQVLAVIAAGMLGFTALSFWIGRALPISSVRATQVLQLAVGTAVVVLVTQLPVLGVLAEIAGWLLVFGAVLRTRFGGQPVLPTTAVPPPPAPPPTQAVAP